MTLGNRITLLRREKKLSQESMAEALNVSRQAVSKWENDLSSPDMNNLIALAALLETDVEFLATGQLAEDMEPEPVPEQPAPPKQEKPRADKRRLLSVLLTASVLLNILFIGLWYHEKRAETLMEEYCAACAASAASHFADYVHNGSDGAYWQGVAAFRSFMTSYRWLRAEESASGYHYQECNILLTSLLYEKERCSGYMERIRRIMRLLGENKDDINVYHDMDVLNNEIRYAQ